MSAIEAPASAAPSARSLRVPTAVAVALAGVILLSPLGAPTARPYIDGSVVDAAALVTAVMVFRRARASEGATRWAWSVLIVGLLGFVVGASWASALRANGHLDLLPAAADISLLLLPTAGAIALAVHPLPVHRAAPSRRLADATMVTASLAIVMWPTILRQADTNPTRLGVVLSVLHPTALLMVLTVALLTVRRLREGGCWPLLSLGLVVLAVADGTLAHNSSAGHTPTGPTYLLYLVGFALVAVAPTFRDAVALEPGTDTLVGLNRQRVLPYVPIVAAVVVLLARALGGQRPDVAQLALLTLLMVALLGRQYLALREITDLSRALSDGEARLRYQAFHDALTGLANRRLFQDRLEHALALHARDLRQVSVLFLDLDDFKIVNDTHGHVVGDELLVRVADRLTARTRVGDTVARLGGDEFAVLLEDGGDASAVAAFILGALSRPVLIGMRRLTVTASLGIVSLDAEAGPTTADQLLTRADTAMYAAKRSGKGRVEWFRAGMSLSEVAEHQQAADLLAGISSGAVRVAYQPIIDISDGSVQGLEALARWNHLGAEVSPDVFIPLAERTGTIGALTDHVLEQACSRLAVWTATTGRPRLRMGVNVPPQQLVSPDFAARIAAAITRHRLGPDQLIVEITERELIGDIARARHAIDELHAVGALVSLDDFGVGYSSLASLHQLQLDAVKVDKSFLDHIDDDPEQARFVSAILDLGRSLDLPVIAEGVERATQLEELRRRGGHLVQGWYFAKALPPEEVEAFITARPQAARPAARSL